MSATRFAPLLRTRVVARTPGFQAIRSISATASYNKGPIDATKDTLKKADRTVSDAAVKGIDQGEKAAHSIKDAVGAGAQQAKAKGEEAKGDAANMAGEGKGKAEEALGQGKGKAEEAMGEAKGKTKEAMGAVEGKAKEAKSRM
ncbi:hypothetical protein PENANT_c002G08230 [Penicillium antarcticum]|uniref:LEA domain protein n=1 Tax=Penicillium antarcticum TaxID=416450 RepID=A0A1V6QKI2_9EURO|nr:uncharacterized protein N7508_008695 [Penicillium antarcticum]KAJ5293874.1 hypothetical protein N7508_008695 [Penicillium antarcticum]OQD89492.1 hypothetical protein PENANT_c002G08230 [Penicillium antarcticum]